MLDQSTTIHHHTLYLNGLNCPNCADKIEQVLQRDSLLIDTVFSFATKKLIFKSTEPLTKITKHIQTTIDTIEDGVKVSPTYALDNTNHVGESCEITNSPSILKRYFKELLGSTLLISLIIYGQINILSIIGYIISYVLIGGNIPLKAFKNLLKGRFFDENFLMTIATLGAFALGEYVEAVAVMFFYKIGEAFQNYAVDHSRKNIKHMLNIKADYANLIIGNSSQPVNPSTLNINDIILIKPGEKIPTDCLLISGTSTISTSALTGESLPLSVYPNDILLSGSINIDVVLKAKVLKRFEDSTVAKILDLVENATSKKAKTEQFITKFARYYTPVIVFSAITLALLPPLLGYGQFEEWLSRALIFLIISCPCALVISIPLGFFGGLGAASKHGILIKGANYLEALNSIDTYVFDKTGTLTKGVFQVQSIVTNEVYSKLDLLKLAALIEIHSTHPISVSITEAYSKKNPNIKISINDVSNVIETPGEGLIGTYDNSTLIVGNERLMARYNIPFKPSSFIGTVVYIAYNNQLIGHINISDKIKTTAFDLIKNLKKEGAKKIVMITGDQSDIALEVATALNIDDVKSQCLPQDKLMHVENLIKNHHKVLFIGDGINDAPVLARADIGVAMGGIGSDAAIEAADIVLMTDDPNKLIIAKKIAKRTRVLVIQNIVFALSVKLFFLSLGALGKATMYEAIFADVGVALLAVLNSMRTLSIKE